MYLKPCGRKSAPPSKTPNNAAAGPPVFQSICPVGFSLWGVGFSLRAVGFSRWAVGFSLWAGITRLARARLLPLHSTCEKVDKVNGFLGSKGFFKEFTGFVDIV